MRRRRNVTKLLIIRGRIGSFHAELWQCQVIRRSWRIACLPHGLTDTESEWWRWRIFLWFLESMTQHFIPKKMWPKMNPWVTKIHDVGFWVCLTMFNPKSMIFRNPLWKSHFSNDFDTFRFEVLQGQAEKLHQRRLQLSRHREPISPTSSGSATYALDGVFPRFYPLGDQISIQIYGNTHMWYVYEYK